MYCVNNLLTYNPTADMPSTAIGPGSLRGAFPDVFCSSIAPPATPYVFAFGTDRGVLVTDRVTHETTWRDHPSHEQRTCCRPSFRDVFALATLSSQPHILMTGNRKGRFCANDFREPMVGDRNAIGFQQSRPITHIKTIYTHNMVISSLDSLVYYDIRFTKTCSSPAKQQRDFGTPVVVFEDYRNSAAIQIGLDVEKEAGIIAAAQDSGERIALYCLKTGTRLTTNFKSSLVKAGQHTRCLQFISECHGRPKSLIFDSGNMIQRWQYSDGSE